MPVAVNWSVNPAATDGVTELTAIDTSDGGMTVRCAVPLILPCAAVITADPVDKAVAKPLGEIEATPELEMLHVAELRFWVLPSLYVPVAVN